MRGYITRPLGRRLGLLFLMGGTQGLVGWWMVRSGLQVGRRALVGRRARRSPTYSGYQFTNQIHETLVASSRRGGPAEQGIGSIQVGSLLVSAGCQGLRRGKLYSLCACDSPTMALNPLATQSV